MENESNRKVTDLLYAGKVDMGGFPVRQPLPTRNVDMIDPFLLLHHAEIKFTENIHPLKEGVGPHPHRGFSPVTFVFTGYTIAIRVATTVLFIAVVRNG